MPSSLFRGQLLVFPFIEDCGSFSFTTSRFLFNSSICPFMKSAGEYGAAEEDAIYDERLSPFGPGLGAGAAFVMS